MKHIKWIYCNQKVDFPFPKDWLWDSNSTSPKRTWPKDPISKGKSRDNWVYPEQCTHGIYCVLQGFLGIMTFKYPLYRAYIGISNRGTLVGVHPTIPWEISLHPSLLTGWPAMVTLIPTSPSGCWGSGNFLNASMSWILVSFFSICTIYIYIYTYTYDMCYIYTWLWLKISWLLQNWTKGIGKNWSTKMSYHFVFSPQKNRTLLRTGASRWEICVIGSKLKLLP